MKTAPLRRLPSLGRLASPIVINPLHGEQQQFFHEKRIDFVVPLLNLNRLDRSRLFVFSPFSLILFLRVSIVFVRGVKHACLFLSATNRLLPDVVAAATNPDHDDDDDLTYIRSITRSLRDTPQESSDRRERESTENRMHSPWTW